MTTKAIVTYPIRGVNRISISGDYGTAPELLRILSQAKKSVVILSPYIILTKKSYALLKSLIEKGVKIEIVTNSEFSSDQRSVAAMYLRWRPRLLQLGVSLWEYKGISNTHAKVAVIDGHITLVGTYNFDPRSALSNREIGVMAVEPEDSPLLATDALDAIDTVRALSWFIGASGEAVLRPGEIPPPPSQLLTRVLKLIIPKPVEALF